MQHRTIRLAILTIASAVVGLAMVASSPADAANNRCKTKCNQDYWMKCLKRVQGTDAYRNRKCQQDRDFCYDRCDGN